MYLNRAKKEIIISLSGVMGFCDKISTSDYVRPEDVDRLKEASRLVRKVMEGMEMGVDDDQLRGLMRFADNCALMIMPNTSPQTNEDLVVVSRETVSRIIDDSLSECFFCEKNVNEAKKCQRRKDLLECGALGRGGSCTFQF